MNKNNEIQVFTLKDIAVIRAGYAFRKKIEFVADGVNIVQMKDVTMRFGLDVSSLQQTKLPGRNPKLWCEEGDILFLARGNNNFATYVPSIKRKTVSSPHFFQIRLTDSNALPQFVVWQINQPAIQDYFARNASGKSPNHLSREVIENIQLGIPPLEEQLKILELQNEVDRQERDYEEIIRMERVNLANIAYQLHETAKQ